VLVIVTGAGRYHDGGQKSQCRGDQADA